MPFGFGRGGGKGSRILLISINRRGTYGKRCYRKISEKPAKTVYCL